jgi:hypothetical protein
MDRFTSSGSDRPICFPEEAITVPLPIRESYYLMEIEGNTETLHGKETSSKSPVEPATNGIRAAKDKHLGSSAYLIRLVAIWGRLVNYFNLGGKAREKIPMWHSSSRFQELAQLVNHFKFPEELRWSQENLEMHRAEKLDNQFVLLHIVYQHIRLFLYRFAIPGYGPPVPRNIPQPFLAESQRTALDAASEVSFLVQHAMQSNVTAPFAGYAAFYSSTVHVQGVFSKNAQVSERSRKNLGINIKFLTQMKRWWGMFHFVAQDLKELFRKHVDANSSRLPDASNGDGDGRRTSTIFQYGDWFDRYPNGVCNAEYDMSGYGMESNGINPSLMPPEENGNATVQEFFSKFESSNISIKKDSTMCQRMLKKGRTDTNGKHTDRPKLTMNTNILDLPNHNGTHVPPTTVSIQQQQGQQNFYFTSTNVNIPIDSFASTHTPYLPTANPMSSMRAPPPPQQLPSPSASTPSATDMWTSAHYYPEPSSAMAGSPYPFNMSTYTGHGADWYIPWNVEPPRGTHSVQRDVLNSPSPAGMDPFATDFENWTAVLGGQKGHVA